MKNTWPRIIVVLAALICAVCVCGMDIEKTYAKDADGDYVVVIDPGHGGGDAGAVSTHTKDSERVLNWNIALALKAELETYEGVKVYLTRGSSEYQSNAGRAQVGKSMGADLNISVHNNSNTNTSPNGVITYGTVDPRFKDNIKNLCLAISKEVSSSVGVKINNGGYGARTSSMGTKYDYYTFLGQSSNILDIPSIIIEHCYLSNANDAKIVHNYANQCKMGAADATAIARYLKLSKRTVSAGSDITLTRTYSAYMKSSKGGTYTSSDESVACVRSDGLITAKKTGSAVITCTAKDGTVETVNVTVPEVKLVGVAGGVIQSSYSSLTDYAKSGMCIKAIYSDGSAKQITSGYTLGSPYVYKTQSGPENEMKVCNVDITYQGKKGTMVFLWYKDSSKISKHNTSLAKPGTNTDILVIPGTYVSTNSSAEIPTVAPQPATKPATQPSTQASTESTSEIVKESEMESTMGSTEGSIIVGTEYVEYNTVAVESEGIVSEENATDVDTDNTTKQGGIDPVIAVCIVLLVVLFGALGVILYVYVKRRKG